MDDKVEFGVWPWYVHKLDVISKRLEVGWSHTCIWIARMIEVELGVSEVSPWVRCMHDEGP